MNLIIEINPDVLWREVDGEIVVLDPKRGYYYGINGVGVRIWTLLQKRTPLPRIIVRLMREFDVNQKRLQIDIKNFIGSLEKSGLLKYKKCVP